MPIDTYRASQMAGVRPSHRWSSEHGFTKRSSLDRQSNGGKRVYRSWWRAWWTARRLNRIFDDQMHVYSCYWGPDYKDGEVAEKHFHVGHETKNDMWGY